MKGFKYKGRIFVISAPSGCGKTTLVYRLIKSGLGLIRSVSMTTRQSRRGEVNNRDYFFVDKKEFEKIKQKGGFLEWAKVLGQYYGTPRKFVESMINGGKDVVLSIDVQGALKIKRLHQDAVSIFLLPPSLNALKDRLKTRSTETVGEMAKRLTIANEEISKANHYDYIVINDNVEKALRKLKAIVIAERCRSGYGISSY